MMLSTIVMVATMHVARAAHTVTALPAGRVLIAGGMPAGGDATRSFEIFDTNRNALTASGDLSFAASTALPDGGALIAGGYDDHGRRNAGVWRFYR